jgi:hypothetical protein
VHFPKRPEVIPGLAASERGDNACMKVFYWLMTILIVGTFIPSALYLAVFLFTGEDRALERARKLWNLSRVFTLFGVNLLIWGHVLVAAWSLFR